MCPPPYLIAFSGKIASGKTVTATQVGRKLFPHTHVLTSFATPLREEVRILMGAYSPHREEFLDNIFTSSLDTSQLSPDDSLVHSFVDSVITQGHASGDIHRFMMQKWGTEVRRKKDPQYWVNKTMSNVADAHAQSLTVLIDDVRFPNEAEAISSHGGILVRLTVNPHTQLQRLTQVRGLSYDNDIHMHPSETALDNYTSWDVIVDNSAVSEHLIISLIEDRLSL